MSVANPPSLEWLEEATHHALKLWHEPESAGSPLQSLTIFQHFQRANGTSARQTSNRLLLAGLDVLATQEPDASKVIRLRFEQEIPGYIVANRLNIAEGTVWKRQNLGIHTLATWLNQQEQQLRSQHIADQLARLELPTYEQLFGVERWISHLSQQINQADAPWLIAIEGLGGMGKTALADKIARQEIAHGNWTEIAWVTARKQMLNAGGMIKPIQTPALTIDALVNALLSQLQPDILQATSILPSQRLALLRERLRSAPHLVVIDNLETLADVMGLLDTVRTMFAPTKFLLTTRHRLLSEADIYHFALAPLGQADALALVRQEAKTRNLIEMAQASDQDLQPIYATVGGNPLALRLVVGQNHVHSLDQILGDLRQARGQPIRNLYEFVYRQAWESLNETEREALILMLVAPEEGADFATLAKLGQDRLSDEKLRNALDHLVGLNLLDARGGLREVRYSIHSLTRTFLHRQVIGWEEGWDAEWLTFEAPHQTPASSL